MADSNNIATSSNIPELTVSELAGALKRTVEDRFGFVRVRGEISGLKIATSGHVYLALKDDSAVLDAVMWKGTAGSLRFRPADGLEVICTGKLTTYPGRSKYQIIIDRMEVAGAGALMALLDARKKMFEAEGLFAAARKKPIPYLPQTIGVITSPTGAVIRDILHRLADRFPRSVLLWPVLVQGDTAAAQVAAAIDGFNAMGAQKPDVLIVARGGGSIEDLWAFNEEVVIRAVAASQIPIISAVGHETDTTLIDYVSDKRAPTPSAAAEMAVPVRADLIETTDSLNSRLTRALRRQMENKRDTLRSAARAMPGLRDLLGLKQQRFDDVAARLPRSLRSGAQVWQGKLDRSAARLSPHMLQRRLRDGTERHQRAVANLQRGIAEHLRSNTQKAQQTARLMDSLSPYNILNRGYAVVRDAKGGVVTTAAAARTAARLQIQFQHDLVPVRVEDSKPKADAPPPLRQGTLL